MGTPGDLGTRGDLAYEYSSEVTEVMHRSPWFQRTLVKFDDGAFPEVLDDCLRHTCTLCVCVYVPALFLFLFLRWSCWPGHVAYKPS